MCIASGHQHPNIIFCNQKNNERVQQQQQQKASCYRMKMMLLHGTTIIIIIFKKKMEAVSRQHLGLFFSLTPPSFLYFALQSLCSRFDHSRSHRVFVNAQCTVVEPPLLTGQNHVTFPFLVRFSNGQRHFSTYVISTKSSPKKGLIWPKNGLKWPEMACKCHKNYKNGLEMAMKLTR